MIELTKYFFLLQFMYKDLLTSDFESSRGLFSCLVSESNKSNLTGVNEAKYSASSRQDCLYPSLTHQWLQMSTMFARSSALTVNIPRIKLDAAKQQNRLKINY